MERKAPPAYPDGVYEIAGQDRPNVLLISNLTQNGFTGRGSASRTAFFIFFGKQSNNCYGAVRMRIIIINVRGARGLLRLILISALESTSCLP